MSIVACQYSIRALAIRDPWPAESAFAQQHNHGSRGQRRLSQIARTAAHGNRLAGIGPPFFNSIGAEISRQPAQSP